MNACFTGYKPARKDFLGVEAKTIMGLRTVVPGEAFSAHKAAKTPVGPVRIDKGGRRHIIAAALTLACFNQKQLGSCEAQAVVGGLMIARPGTPMLSRRGIYLLCLLRDGAFTADGLLDDRGTDAETIHTVLLLQGCCLESWCEYRDNSEDWRERPSLDALLEGWAHRIDATHRIVSFGEQLGVDIRASIDAGRPVQDGGPCSQAYQDAFDAKNDNAVFDTMLPSIGGHARLIVGYELLDDGTYRYLERGSYGDDGGDAEFAGHVWISEKCLREYDEFFSVYCAPVFAA